LATPADELVTEIGGEHRYDQGEHADDLVEHRADREERPPGHVGSIGAAQVEDGQLHCVVPQAVREAEAEDDQRHHRGVAQARGTAASLAKPPHEDGRQAHQEHRWHQKRHAELDEAWIEVSSA
jgi:hypothetical protein